ncbi:unnamed protein product, partial [Effrenium voratum]
SMSAVVAQLRCIKAFSSPHSGAAHRALREGQAFLAEESLRKVLAQEEGAVPSWELQMATSGRMNALEELMSWKNLQGVLQNASDFVGERPVRAELGLSLLDGDPGARGALDLRLQKAAAALADASLAASEASARQAALLAVHAAATRKWDDARRLIYQGYDAFSGAWNRLPLLAQRARHERLSALPLLQGLEQFLETPEETQKGAALSLQHDRFSAWVDHAFGQVALCRLRGDGQAEATAYAELGRRCMEARNFQAAQDMMRRCLQKRKFQDYRFFDNVLELKLCQKEKQCLELCSVARKELGKHQDPETCLRYTLILAKIAKAGWERSEMNHQEAWQALKSARGFAESCSTAEQSKTHAKLAEFADAVLRREEASGLSATNVEQVELVESLITGVLTAICLGEGAGSTEAFRQAHERLPRVFELLALFKGCSHVFQAGVVSVPAWPFLRWLPQALAHLPNVPALQGPLQALASEYPQALIWPLQLSSHQDVVAQRGSAFQPLWAALERSQAPVQTAVTFTRALERLTHPEKSFPPELRSVREAILA